MMDIAGPFLLILILNSKAAGEGITAVQVENLTSCRLAQTSLEVLKRDVKTHCIPLRAIDQE